MAKKRLSEKQAGYLMVFPALLIILVIAIWPVVRSFWISLYDVRLNDPTKSQIHSSYGIDLERYANGFPLLKSNITKESQEVEPPVAKTLDAVMQSIQSADQELRQDQKFADQYKQVDDLLFDYKPVPEDLKFFDADKQKAEKLKQTLQDADKQLLDLANNKQLKHPDDVLGVVRGMEGSIIEPNFVGLAYYKQFLSDSRMWSSLGNTALFTVVSVVFELVLGLWIAVLINKQFVGRGLVRAAVLIPWAIPTVISALMWKFMYDGQNGILSHLMWQVGLISDPAVLLTTKAGAMFSTIFADVWKTTPFMALLLFAGLQTVPESLYEAAEVDGATKAQQFWRITLPMLKSSIMVALLFRTLDAFRVFDLIYVLTGGGPANSTETISIYAYKTMFAQMEFGAGSALSVLVFLCVALISMGYIKILGADLLGDNSGK
ncbi:carbohydrate ABC transporter permease [Tumebacillus permanentifrigoris]|uniref:Carbohydrate ABC transporter membrane protein 1 (CUT1 family) n=1 Tax=Tumebacillus permanentifrigoris TaxID=378543 RepID=A0A316D9I4_9BACL|nr:sugar ABC transporter permease [Tumebacillus permanentifrigoris]PWK13835.1 carbohydrate ABC transporter membrane protein 1 (CUT1 family) [Tumebacillus permanentifrigoris]